MIQSNYRFQNSIQNTIKVPYRGTFDWKRTNSISDPFKVSSIILSSRKQDKNSISMPTLNNSGKYTDNPPSSSLSVKPNFSYATKAGLRNA